MTAAEPTWAEHLATGWRPVELTEQLRPLEPIRVVPRHLAPTRYRYRLRPPEEDRSG